MKNVIFLIISLSCIETLAQPSEQLVRNGVLVVEKLDFDDYVNKRQQVMKTAYEENRIDSQNALTDFENKSYESWIEMYRKLISGFVKNEWETIQMNQADYANLKGGSPDDNKFFIELNMTVEQFKSGALALTSGFILTNSDGLVLFNEGSNRLIRKIKKQAL